MNNTKYIKTLFALASCLTLAGSASAQNCTKTANVALGQLVSLKCPDPPTRGDGRGITFAANGQIEVNLLQGSRATTFLLDANGTTLCQVADIFPLGSPVQAPVSTRCANGRLLQLVVRP